MKIYNRQPIKVQEYFLDKSNLENGSRDIIYQARFDFGYTTINSLDAVNVSFEMQYYVGFNEELLFRYISYSQFNFIAENFKDDIVSIEKYLNEYYSHTKLFLDAYGHKSMKELDEHYDRKIETSAELLLQMLDWNGKYPFKITENPELI